MLSVVIQGLGFVGSAMSIAVASRVDSKGDPLFSAIGIDLPTKEGHKKILRISLTMLCQQSDLVQTKLKS